MDCGQDRAALEAYLDGEATTEQESALRQHLQACTVCAAELGTMIVQRRHTRAAATRFTPSPEFRRKVQAEVAARPRRFPTARFVVATALSLAAMILIVIWMRQSSLQAGTFREVADLHVSDLASANPYDVISSDRHTVKPWFQGRIPFAFNLPEFAGTEFTLLGGRVVYLQQQPAAQMMVAAGKHKISMIIAQETVMHTVFPLSHAAIVRNSFNVETWSRHGLTFFFIGDADKAEIQKLAAAVSGANQ